MLLLEQMTTASEDPVLAAIEGERHAVLYSLGRYEEADAIYAAIETRCTNPIELTEAACGQIVSLVNRRKAGQALLLGMKLLGQLGLDTPKGDTRPIVAARLPAFYEFIAKADPLKDKELPEMSDPRMCAVSKIIGRLLPPAFLSNPQILAWLVVQSQRLWEEFGPSPGLLMGLACAGTPLIAIKQDFRTAYLFHRYTLSVGEARGYEPETSWARAIFAVFGAHWLEPVEECGTQAQRAREGLLRGGDLMMSCVTYYGSLYASHQCAPTIETVANETESGLALPPQTR